MTHLRLVMLCISSLTIGCLSVDYTPTVQYALYPRTVATVRPDGGQSNAVVAVRSVLAARNIKRDMLVLDDSDAFHPYPNAEWSEPPADTVTRLITDTLRNSGRFADVAQADEPLLYDYLVTGELRWFHARRTDSQTVAECRLVLSVRKGLEKELLVTRTFTTEAPLNEDSPAGFADAMTRALEELAEDIRATMF